MVRAGRTNTTKHLRTLTPFYRGKIRFSVNESAVHFDNVKAYKVSVDRPQESIKDEER